MTENLLPCPFCGGVGELNEVNAWWVRCDQCNAETEAFMSPEEATAAWNRRPPPPQSHMGQSSGVVERLRACQFGLFWPEARDAIAEIEKLNGDIVYLQMALDVARTTPPVQHVSLTIGALQQAHIERQEEWCPDQKPDLSFRGNELGGECGEAQNVIKKLERERHGWRGSRDTVGHLAEELADVIHCAVLVAITAGIEIEPAVIAKFNSTSEKNGLSTFLATTEGSADA